MKEFELLMFLQYIIHNNVSNNNYNKIIIKVWVTYKEHKTIHKNVHCVFILNVTHIIVQMELFAYRVVLYFSKNNKSWNITGYKTEIITVIKQCLLYR